MSKFEQEGIIRRTYFLDLYSLKLSSAIIYFSTNRTGEKLHSQLLKVLSDSRQVTWLAELGGDYQYGMSLTVSSPGDAHVFLASLSSKISSLFRDKAIVFQTGLALFPRKFFSNEYSGQEELYCSALRSHKVLLDDIDSKIVGILCDQPNITLRDLGAIVSKSHSAVENRIEKLKNAGIIIGEYYRVDARKLGYQTYKLFLYAKGFERAFADNLRAFCRKHQWIVSFIECIGSWDFEIGVDARSPEGVIPVIRMLYESFPDHIATIKTVPVFKVQKFQQYSNV